MSNPATDNRMEPTTDAAAIARLQAENSALRAQLEEAEDALRAIREGEVDAVIVSGSHGDRVFSLMETENLHRLMVETMNEAGFATSPDGLLLYCNGRASTLLRRPRSALLGRRLDEFVAPQDAERLRALLDASTSGTADDRLVFCADDGSAVPLHLWVSRLDRPGTEMICLVGTDLTRFEADRALVAQLEEQQRALSASRAEALALMDQALAAREQATQAAAELRASDQRKDAFLATLAHELRNPLAPIRNALETLRLTDVRDPDALTALEVMARQLAHLVRLVDDLMEISRITRGTIDLRKQPVELAAVISTAVETVRPMITAGQQRLSLELPSRPLWLEADPLRLSQVFGNLLNNASKYSGSGGEITLAVREQDGGVLVCVRDNGVGIPADLLPYVFDLFRHGDPDQLQGQAGLGIGLSLVKTLTELHGGWVEASSAGPGLGSELRLFLPDASAVPPARVAPETVPARPEFGHGSPRTILVVDDNRDAANSLAALFQRAGCEVRVAFDGLTALERLDERLPDLVILDIGMPGMDGHEVARRIRARTDGSRPTLIAMSGLGQEADRRRSMAAGFDRHLVKPVPLDVLETLVAAPWGPRPANPPAAQPVAPETAASPLQAIAPIAAALLHELAQPINTAGCYAVAARNIVVKSNGDKTRLCDALRGIDQQIQLAGTAMDRLRELFLGATSAGSLPRPEAAPNPLAPPAAEPPDAPGHRCPG